MKDKLQAATLFYVLSWAVSILAAPVPLTLRLADDSPRHSAEARRLHQHHHRRQSNRMSGSLEQATHDIYDRLFMTSNDKKEMSVKLDKKDLQSQELVVDPFERRRLTAVSQETGDGLQETEDGLQETGDSLRETMEVGESLEDMRIPGLRRWRQTVGKREYAPGRVNFQPDSLSLRDPTFAAKHSKDATIAEPLQPRELPKPSEDTKSEAEMGRIHQSTQRRKRVVAALKFAYGAYEKYAFGFDELQPETMTGINNFGALGATIIDSIDTLWMAGLKDEVDRATAWVDHNLDFNQTSCLSLFESHIRIIGGLVSAYETTAAVIFLNRAQELADRLMPAFNTSNGLPCNQVCLPEARPAECGMVGLAEVGTFSVEFFALSAHTGDPKYINAADRIFKELRSAFPDIGLLPSSIHHNSPSDTGPRSHLSVSGGTDSYYEYLIKYWILTGCKAEDYRLAWEAAVDEMLEYIFFYTKDNPTAFIGEAILMDDKFSTRHVQGHLACFMPGNIVLGIMYNAVPPEKKSKYFAIAHDLTKGCYSMYAQSPTGLSPESVHIDISSGNLTIEAPYQWLRPEVVESIFYMWRLTKNKMYRNWAWQIFLAFEKHSRVHTGGYSGLYNAWDVSMGMDNQMQSFFVAETLKYLYMIFDDNAFPLDQWVFNTEAHPVKMRNKGCKFDLATA